MSTYPHHGESHRISDVDTGQDELTETQLHAEFPRWETWTGIAGLKYARRHQTSPPALVRGEDWTALRDEIQGWEGKHLTR